MKEDRNNEDAMNEKEEVEMKEVAKLLDSPYNGWRC